MSESSAKGLGGDSASDVSKSLRDAREKSGMSLRELARRLDISASALSQIETGKSRPSVRTLYALVSELGLSMDDLFANPTEKTAAQATPASVAAPADSGVQVTLNSGSGGNGAGGSPIQRAMDRAQLELDTGVTWERLTSGHDALVDFLYCNYEVGGTSNAHGSLVRHTGQEYGIVLKGELDVTIGFETYHLEVGDSISFNSNEPHVLANNGTGPAEAIWFVIGRRQSDPRNPAFEPGESAED